MWQPCGTVKCGMLYAVAALIALKVMTSQVWIQTRVRGFSVCCCGMVLQANRGKAAEADLLQLRSNLARLGPRAAVPMG